MEDQIIEPKLISVENAFVDVAYKPPVDDNQYPNFIRGTIGGLRLTGNSVTAGVGAKTHQIRISNVRTREKLTIGDPVDPDVVLGQLIDQTGVDQYGIWIRSGAAYIAGYRLFEAVVDPAGLGDYTTIAEALAAGKTRLFLRNGVHILSADLVISSSNAVLEGESQFGVVIQSGASAGAAAWNIQVTGNGVTIKNLTKSQLSSSTPYLIDVSGNNFTLQNCYLVNSSSSNKGIRSSGASTRITDNLFSIGANLWNISGNGFVIKNNIATVVTGDALVSGSNGVVADNSITRTSTGSYCFDVAGTNNTVSGNYFKNSSVGSTSDGIRVEGSFNRVMNNYIEGHYNGIVLQGDQMCTIAGNTLKSQGAYGIVSTSAVNTSGNGLHIISGNTVYSAADAGIKILYGTKILVVGNTVYNCTNYGFQLDNSANAQNCTFSHNYAANCGDGFYGTKGSFSHTNNNWVNNQAYANGRYGFFIDCTNSNITNNISISNSTANYSVTNTGGNYTNNI